MDSGDLNPGDTDSLTSQPKAPPGPAQKGLKGVGFKKGAKLARSRGKQSVTLNNKVDTKKSLMKSGGGK